MSAWWQIAWPVWSVLLVGYGWCAVSIVSGFRPAASGAVLVGFAIVADLLLQRFLWKRAAQFFTGFFHRIEWEKNLPYEAERKQHMINWADELDTLKLLARPTELSIDGEMWAWFKNRSFE